MKYLIIALYLLPLGIVNAQTILVVPISEGDNPEINDVLIHIEETLQENNFELINSAQATKSLKQQVIFYEPIFDVAAWNERIDSGVSAYVYTDWQKAINLLEEALIPIFDKPELLTFNPDMVARTRDGGLTLLRALMMEESGEEYISDWTIRLVTLFPYMEINSEKYPPEIVELYAGIQKEMLDSASDVVIEIPGADSCTITLNGTLIDRGSVVRLQVPKGRHVVRADCNSKRSLVHILEVTEEDINLLLLAENESTLSLAPRPTLSKSDFDNPSTSLLMARLLTRLTGAELLLFVGFTPPIESQSQYLQISVCNGNADVLIGSARLPREHTKDAEQIRKTLETAFGNSEAEGIFAFDGEVFRPINTIKDTALWFWITFGTGMALVAGGTISYILGELNHQEITKTEGYGLAKIDKMSRTEALNLEDLGNTKKLVGSVLWGIGGAVLVGSIILFFLDSSEQEGSISAGFAPISNGGLLSIGGTF